MYAKNWQKIINFNKTRNSLPVCRVMCFTSSSYDIVAYICMTGRNTTHTSLIRINVTTVEATHAEHSNSTTNYLALLPGSVGSLESVVHTDHILITFIMMNHPLTYYLSVTHCGGKTYGKIIGSTRQTDTAVLTIHSTIYGVDSDAKWCIFLLLLGSRKCGHLGFPCLLDIPVEHD